VLLNAASGNTFEAQSVENWLVKAAHLGHFRVNVKRIAIVGKAVNESLVGSSDLFLLHIGSTFRRLREILFDGSFVSKSTEAAHEQTRPHNALDFFGF